MANPSQILDVLQADLISVLQDTPALADVFIFTGSEKDLATRLSKALGTRTVSEDGKRGIALQVLPIYVTEAESNLPGPPIKLRCQVLIVENLRINRAAATGTLLTSSQAALNVLNALHHRTLGAHALVAEKNPIAPEKIDEGFESHLVTLFAHANGITGPGKPLQVQAVMTDGELILTCGTAGSSIRYTLDGTYPSTSASLYTTPIAGLVAGDIVRAAAYADDLNPGDCAEITVTE